LIQVVENEGCALQSGKEGNKIGWFRLADAELIITSQWPDAQASPLEAKASYCYSIRFQASGAYFPTEGWEVTAQVEDSKLSSVVWVEP
jgi:hypothetical protein